MKKEPVTYSDLEPVICDLQRSVKIVELLLFHDAEESGWKTEYLSILAMEDLTARAEELKRLFCKAVADEDEDKPRKPLPEGAIGRPENMEAFAEALGEHADAIVATAKRKAAAKRRRRKPKLTLMSDGTPA